MSFVSKTEMFTLLFLTANVAVVCNLASKQGKKKNIRTSLHFPVQMSDEQEEVMEKEEQLSDRI